MKKRTHISSSKIKAFARTKAFFWLLLAGFLFIFGFVVASAYLVDTSQQDLRRQAQVDPYDTCYYGASSCASLGRLDSSNCDSCPSGAGVCCGTTIPQVCTPNHQECLGGSSVRRCNLAGTAYITTQCASGVCQGNACAPVLKNEGESCESNGQCKTGLLCASGTCRTPQICTPGTTDCVTGSILRTCNAQGTGTTTTNCPSGLCQNGACVATLKQAGQTCETNAECQAGLVCGNRQPKVGGTCMRPATPTPTVTVTPVGQGGTPGVRCYYGSSSCSSLGRAQASGCSSCSPGAGVCCGAIVSQVCTPGSSTCLNNGVVRICKTDGSGYSDVVCSAGSSCQGNRCVQQVASGNSCSEPHGTAVQGNLFCCDGKVKDGQCVGPIDTGDETKLADGTWCFWRFNVGSCANCASGTTYQDGDKLRCGSAPQITFTKPIQNGELCVRSTSYADCLCVPTDQKLNFGQRCSGNVVNEFSLLPGDTDPVDPIEDPLVALTVSPELQELVDTCFDIYTRTGQYPSDCANAFAQSGYSAPPPSGDTFTAQFVGTTFDSFTQGGEDWMTRNLAILASVGKASTQDLLLATAYQLSDLFTLGGQSTTTNSFNFASDQCRNASTTTGECLAHTAGALGNAVLSAFGAVELTTGLPITQRAVSSLTQQLPDASVAIRSTARLEKELDEMMNIFNQSILVPCPVLGITTDVDMASGKVLGCSTSLAVRVGPENRPTLKIPVDPNFPEGGYKGVLDAKINQGVATITNVRTVSAYERQGIGSSLVNELMQLPDVYVIRANPTTEAIRKGFYEANGFYFDEASGFYIWEK